MNKTPSYEQDQEPVPRKIREVNGPGGFCLPCFFRDRDFEKFEMQRVKTQRKEKEHTTVCNVIVWASVTVNLLLL